MGKKNDQPSPREPFPPFRTLSRKRGSARVRRRDGLRGDEEGGEVRSSEGLAEHGQCQGDGDATAPKRRGDFTRVTSPW